MLETISEQPANTFTIHEFHGPTNHFFPKYLVKGIPSVTDVDPYCFSSDENWQEMIDTKNETNSTIIKTPPISICLADPDTPPYYKEQYIAPVLIKSTDKKNGLETGLTISPNGDLFITSGVYQDKDGKKFVLLARKAIIVMENVEKIKNKYF
jgi:hypothetical protein